MHDFRKAAFLAAFALAAVIGWVPGANTQETADATSSETYRQLQLFGDVFELVREKYVEEISDEQLIEAAIQGMLSSLDPHSDYLNPKNYRDMQIQTRGEFGGLGIEVTMEGGYVKVVTPIDDTPAFRAGIKAGDLVIQLDGEPVLGLTLNQAVEKMRGAIGSKITLTILREGMDPFDVSITRDRVQIKAVKSRLEGNVGYVRISSFSENADVGLKAAIADLQKQAGGKLVGFVLDLRNNPGGLLDQAISVSDVFLDRGEVVSTRGRNPDNAQRFNATPGDLTGGLPLVVLINAGSASASEIVAGALQDHRRAILVGTRSFGKGSVQTILQLGSDGAMKLTTQRYYTPSGRSIQAKGIEPDIEVRMAKLEYIDGEEAQRHEANLRGALDGEAAPPAGDARKPEDAKKPDAAAEPEKEPEDYQLTRALDLLRGIALYRATQAE